MKKAIGVFLIIFISLIYGEFAWANGTTYSLKQIGENTITITLNNTELKEGEGIEITSASKRGGKVLNIFYRIKNDVKEMNSMDVDLRTMLPPIRVILTDISNPDKVSFPDIKDIYAEEYIRHLHDMGAINGFPDGTFKPEKKVSRAEFVTMILNSLQITSTKLAEVKFKDISEQHWATNSINTAYNMKLINGFPDGTFRPNETITSAQASIIIDKLFKFTTIVEDTDLSALNKKHWAYNSIKNMMNAGIIVSEDELFKEFNENIALSRADCAIMISRAITTK